MELHIRQASISDLPYINEICLKTGLGGNDASESVSDKHIIAQYFATPYLYFEIDSCFVLENKSAPVGYILGVKSTIRFNHWMNKAWLPDVRKLYPASMKSISNFEKFLIDLIHKDCNLPDFLNDYPSHLHIDLLPIAQQKGYGKKLIMTFISNLKASGSSGLHLAVGIKNKSAIAFYKAIGFEVLKKESKSLFMGLSFDMLDKSKPTNNIKSIKC